MLAAYRGDEVDRLPYWPKIANPTWCAGQPESVAKLSNRELLDAIGADGRFPVPSGVETHRPHVESTEEKTDSTRTVLTRTPDGELQEVWTLDPYTRSWHPTEFPVKTAEDIARLRWVHTDVTHRRNDEICRIARQRVTDAGQRGITISSCGTSPIMNLVEHLVGPVNFHFMLADHTEAMDEVIELMHADCLARYTAAAEYSPADVIASIENTSTTLISPDQFRRYCLGHLADYGRAITAAGKLHELHMCGHTHALLPDIDTLPAASIEAFTAPTLGNTRLVDGRTLAPSKTLLGGTNVNTWLLPVEEIKQYILDELAACPDHRHIVLTTAGVAPPGCPLETFAEIGRWIPSLPLKL